MTDEQPGPVSYPTLVMSGGPLDGTEYPLPLSGKPVVLGSSMDADVQILLGNIEAAHAFVTFTGEELVLSDAGSATGTFVNGEKVEGDRALRDGDRICLGPPGAKGSAKLLLRLPSGVAAPPAVGGHDHAPALADHGPAPALGGEPAPALSTGPAAALDDGPIVAAAPESGEPLFAAPLPPAPPPEPTHAARPPASAVPPPPPAPAPPPPPPAAVPPPPPRAAASRPEYHADLPSIPVAQGGETQERMRAAEFPSLRPSQRPQGRGGRGRVSARRKSLLPSLPLVPLAGGLAALAVVAGLAWLLVFRASPPRIAAIRPARTEAGLTVTIAGKNFAKDAAGNTVRFGTLPAVVQAASASELTVVVPAAAKDAMPVSVETKGGVSAPVTVTVLARGEARMVQPDVAMPGQRILVRGEGLTGQVSVRVAGLAATGVETTPEGVRAVVPDVGLPEGAKTTVTVQAGSAPVRSFDFMIGRLPLVLGVKPEAGPPGQLVAIEGRGFAPDRRANQVSFAGVPALVISAAQSELKVIVPVPAAGDLQPELAVVVKTGDRTSSSRVYYQLARAATSGFRPRFFPAPVAEYPGEDLAFVSTEIGPVLLLAGRAGGPAAADRALAASSALNAVVDAASGKTVSFELRERENAVGVAGDPRPLLAPTPEDVAAYSKPWETGKGPGRRLTAAAVARYWTALLQDYLGLFLGRQRPIQVLALSPRGRVLSDIYSEASRRAPGEPTVPTSIVLPTSATMAAALRQMALVVSAEAPRAVVAIEGRWQGSIDDPDHGTQTFQAQLRADGGRLSGTITTRSGPIEVNAPLREVAFDRGSLRFTADLQGAVCRFKGTLNGNAVTGTVERQGKPALPFAMQYQD